jgi:hypothetical protein
MPIRRQPALVIPASRVLAAAQMSHLQHRTEGLWAVGRGQDAVGQGKQVVAATRPTASATERTFTHDWLLQAFRDVCLLQQTHTWHIDI